MKPAPTPRAEEGMALLTVLLLLTLLMLLAVEFSFATKSEIKMAGNFQDSTRAYYLALAGVDRAVDEIVMPADFCFRDDATGETHFGRNAGAARSLSDWVEEARENVIRRGIEVEDGYISYSIRDEDALLQINRADEETLARLLEQLGIQIGSERDEIIDAILDWKDADDLRGLNGAEDDYYSGLEVPYSTRGRGFKTPLELSLVRGITPELFYGDDEMGTPGLFDFITTWGTHRTPNRNTAPYPVLVSVFGEGEAEQIINSRTNPDSRPRSQADALSRYFTIVGEGQMKGSAIYRQVRAVVQTVGRRRGGSTASSIRVVYWDDSNSGPQRRIAP